MKPIERFDPQLMGGRLLEAEHVARYRWAAALVEGKRVLDAGCGTGYGAELLARAGAAAVVGVDIDAKAVPAAAKEAAVSFVTADLRALPADLGEFDVVVCFEVLEHIEEPEAALDSLAGTLGPGGVLLVSSPNKDVYPPGNPYHVHEFRPDELAEALAARFAHVRLVRQHDWLAVGIFEDDDFGRLEPLQAPVAKAVGGEPGKELYSLGLASNEPAAADVAARDADRDADVKWWQEQLRDDARRARGEEGPRARARGVARKKTQRRSSSRLRRAEAMIASMKATQGLAPGNRATGTCAIDSWVARRAEARLPPRGR